MDARDVLLGGAGSAAAPPADGKPPRASHKAREAGPRKPKDVSREVWQLGGAAAPVVPAAGLKDKRRHPPGYKKGKVSWAWKPFTNSARTDSLVMKHWVKTTLGGGGRLGSNGGDAGGDYAFAKYNKRCELLTYNDEEWDTLLAGEESDWTREETDHLLDLLGRYDLRFVVVADRWQLPTTRSVEQMKDRYYGVARKLLEARAETAEEVANHPLVRDPFNAEHESARKAALARMMERSKAADKEEQDVLRKAVEIEERRRKEGLAAQVAAGRVAASKGGVDLKVELPEDVQLVEYPLGPSLPNIRGTDERPPPGVYARGLHTIAVANEMATLAGGSARAAKRMDQTLEDLGVKPPQVPTHAVCHMWMKLRNEVWELLELRKQLARKQQEVAARQQGLPEGAAGVEGTPTPGALGGLGVPFDLDSKERAKRASEKRKVPARYAEDASPPRRASEKRQKRH